MSEPLAIHRRDADGTPRAIVPRVENGHLVLDFTRNGVLAFRVNVGGVADLWNEVVAMYVRREARQ